MAEHASLADLAAQLAAMLQGKPWRKAWSQLQQKLADIVTAVADPRTTVQDLLRILEETKQSSLAPGNSDAEAVLGRIWSVLEEAVRDVPKANLLKDLVLLVATQLNMIPLCNAKPVYMIDADSNFCKGNVDRIVRCSDELSAPNAPYAVISIVGAQNSGKSYLLNQLFGTKFPEMDANVAWKKTSIGIMVSRCIGPSVLVLDVEGFDGKEKGQDTLLENQAALFALTISDLMIVNMSVHDIGRELAGGTPLFRTIFQERTKLPQCLTKMLVVLRYYNGEGSLDILRNRVLNSMEEIWKSVNIESVKFKNYIEVNVVVLLDKKSSKFPNQVAELRKLLSNNIRHSRSAKVPASGFSDSSRLFWDTIKNNKQLDIPSHQVAVAKLFCWRLVQDTLDSLDSRTDFKLLKDQQSPQHFKEISDALFQSITTKYDQETEMYDPEERNKGRQYLVEKLYKIFTDYSGALIKKVKQNTIEQFKREFNEDIENIKEDATDKMVDECVENFTSWCGDLKVFHGAYFDSICGDLKHQLHAFTIHRIKERNEERARQLREDVLDVAKVVGKVALKVGLHLATGGAFSGGN